MKEIWKDISGYEGLYQVSNLGRVKSLPKSWISGIGKIVSHDGMVLRPSINSDGYKMVSLSKDKKSKSHKIHRLVAETFLENNENLPQIDHIDSDKTNNVVNNLRWCYGRQNATWKNEKKKGKSSKYVGVDFCKRVNKFRARIIIEGFQHSLGYYKNEEEARYAYLSKVESLYSVKG